MNNEYDKEELLAGGNVSEVYKSGNTVRRALRPDSDKIHALLQHLQKKEFPYAPKFLGNDDKGREVLTFIEGEAGNYPLKEYMWSDEALKETAKMLRHYHEAVSDFPISAEWTSMDKTPDHPEVICHNDFAVYNMIFRDQTPIGIIDFDHAAPGPRLWDIAYCLYTCVPLSRFYHAETGEKVHYDAAKDAGRKKRRVSLFFDNYGAPALKAELLEMLILRLEGLCAFMRRKSQEGDQDFQKMIEEGHDKHYLRDIEFIQQHGKDWV